MKHLLFILILIISPFIKAEAQEYSTEFGKIGKEEAALISYAPDKSAAAVVLFDIGKSRFEELENSFEVIFEKSRRIKIFSDAGLKWAEVEIPYYHEGAIFEQIYELEAFTYNQDGESFMRTALNPGSSHDEKINDFWSVKKFAMPDVKAGSIIEYRYKIRSQYKFNLRNWEFQSRIPTIYSEYEIRMIPFYEYTWILQGASKFDSNSSYKYEGLTRNFGPIEYSDMVHKFIMKKIPAFNDEEYITSINDYIIKLEFQLVRVTQTDGTISNIISTWPELVKILLKDEDMTKFAKKCEKLAAKFINPDSLKNKSPKGKFDFILDYVKGNFNWNEINGKYSTKSPGDLLKEKFGNDADLNLLAVGLLNSAGIEAFPLIISTRDNGKIKADYPLVNSFNYVVICAIIDGKKILSDATEILCPNDLIPSRCLNDKGLLIKEGPVEWVSLQSSVPSEIHTTFKIDSVGNSTRANTSLIASGYDALRYRRAYGDDKKKIAERGEGDEYKTDESSVLILNTNSKELQYIFGFNTNFTPELINNKYYLSPFLNEPMTENPLKQNARSYQIDMTYPVKRSYTSTIRIPDGYKVDFRPEDEKILNDLFELNYILTYDERTISVSFNYTFKKPLYESKDYLSLKYYFREIIKKGNEKIVLAENH